jgi:hypothetical protein
MVQDALLEVVELHFDAGMRFIEDLPHGQLRRCGIA